MFKKIYFHIVFILLISISLWSQTKVSGIVLDNENQPIPFANVVFKGTTIGVVTDEQGKFYIESNENQKTLVVAFSGFETKEIMLTKAINYDFKIKLSDGKRLKEVVIFTGKTSKKNNPALDILRKIWERKRKNGLRIFKQYQLDKYEKIEFDMNTIDSAFMKSSLFKGMEFVFKHVDTSKFTGKTYLPIFINESLSEVYGDNTQNKIREVLKANKNSGFENNQKLITFVKDLYADYDIYNNYITLFDKSFTSPLSRTGIDMYNYVLRDSAYIKNKWCYNIIFYPRRKGELTFKGDFWVNDTTFAIKTINMAISKSANINWVKDIYIEQEFDVLNDSVFLLTKDYLMSDFAFSKKEASRGIYGKRTSIFKNHLFNTPKPSVFYQEEANFIDNNVYNKPDSFWEENRFEALNKNEKGIYKMIDTLNTIPKFRQINDIVQILGSGYYNRGIFDYGPILSTVGFNQVEGTRLRFGMRTYFGPNDTWRLQGYTAYGFRDDRYKYGISGKWMVDKKNRVILSAGNRIDIEQIGSSLTNSNDVLGRNFASSALFTSGSNGKLTHVNISSLGLDIEPIKNITFHAGFSYRILKTASDSFNLDYFSTLPSTTNPNGVTQSDVNQAEWNLQVELTPKRKTIGYGVERSNAHNPFSRIYINYSKGFTGFLNSDFNYDKIQLYYKQPIIIGPLGRSNISLEVGKTFGNVSLGLLNIIPGNQTYFSIDRTFNNLNFYEFVSDQYATVHWEHQFQGRLFARLKYVRKLNWREIIGVKSAYGTVSDANKAINASGLVYHTPDQVYYEYFFGIGNIFKVFRIDFSWRGNYLNMPDATRFAVKGSFGFFF